MSRLTSDIWVSAYLTRLRLSDIPAFVVARGDSTAGAVLVKLNTLDGRGIVFQRSFDLVSGVRNWMELVSGDEPDLDVAISRQRSFDPDLWVIEVEDREGRYILSYCSINCIRIYCFSKNKIFNKISNFCMCINFWKSVAINLCYCTFKIFASYKSCFFVTSIS